MAKYLDKWKDLFPDTVGGTTRPSEAVSDQEEFNTDGFPQFIAQDPVNYALQNAFLKQFLSNDAWLWVKQKQANQALDDHKVDTQAHAKGISGNAGSATKLANARTINLSGAVTADAVSFDGTANATINVKTLDASKLKGTASVSTTGNAATATKVVTTAEDGASANIAEAKMASNDLARIRVSGTANAGELALETADDGSEPIVARQYTGIYTTPIRTAKILDESGNTSFPGTVVAPKFTGALNGNAATASKLATPRTISLTGKAAGSTSFDGSANASINVTSVNADTASKLSTARKINITGNATGAATFDGTSDVNINVSVSQAAHADRATQDANGLAFTDTNAYMHIRALADNTDFNNVKTTGIYYCTGNTYSNRPHNSWGILTVYSIGTVKQEYRPDNAAVYYTREYNNKNWTEWSKVAASTADSATTATKVNATAPNGGAADLAFGTMAANDYARIRVYGKDDNGALEIATADGGNEPIYARQYSGAYDWPNGRPGTVTNEAAILDSNGNTKFPKNVTAASFTGPLNGNAATATKLATPRTISLTGNASGSANFDGSGNVSINTTVSTAAKAGVLSSPYTSNTRTDSANKLYADGGVHYFLATSKMTEGKPPEDGAILHLAWDNNSSGGWETQLDIGTNSSYWRSQNAGTWGAWKTFLDSNNYNNYAPTKTGGGASGTWGISITGNAASATNADKLDGYHASDLLGKIYPVGSIYMSMSATNPHDLFGVGTWKRISQGRMLLGADDSTYKAGATGGEATHTLTAAEMPAHSHGISTSGDHSHYFYGSDNNNGPLTEGDGLDTEGNGHFTRNERFTTSSAGAHTHTIDNAGGGAAHNNMPPYLVCYIWQRTA